MAHLLVDNRVRLLGRGSFVSIADSIVKGSCKAFFFT